MKESYPKIQIIGSIHLDLMPASLSELLEKMHHPHIFSYKIAVRVQSALDILTLLLFTKEHKQLTCIGLGPEGIPSRVLAPLFGSQFCYGSVGEGNDPSLPSISLRELVEVYQVKIKSPQANIYALLGDPVDKSIGHLFHNRHFSKDAIYVKFRIVSPELTHFFSLMRQLPFRGFSVTMPLKEQLERFLTRIAPAAASIGSVNTIVFENDHLIGYNTDGAGAIAALSKHCSRIQGLRVTILGAGGSARALAYEFQQRGNSVRILNRTLERAEALAKAFECRAGKLEDLCEEPCDLLINTVPVNLLFDWERFPSVSYVMDLVYWEEETPLLKIGKKKGATCIHGLEVFEEQARLQQKLWFGQAEKS